MRFREFQGRFKAFPGRRSIQGCIKKFVDVFSRFQGRFRRIALGFLGVLWDLQRFRGESWESLGDVSGAIIRGSRSLSV